MPLWDIQALLASSFPKFAYPAQLAGKVHHGWATKENPDVAGVWKVERRMKEDGGYPT
jgi:hypothetical protein